MISTKKYDFPHQDNVPCTKGQISFNLPVVKGTIVALGKTSIWNYGVLLLQVDTLNDV